MHQPEGKTYVFRSSKTPKSSIWKQLETKIVRDHSRFQKLQMDKEKAHAYLKLCNYQDCWIS